MDSYQITFETWNKVASLYEANFMHLDLYDHTYDALCDLLPPTASVLEIGCGPGNITHYLLKKRPDLEILGIDVAPNMIALAQKNNPTAQFEVMDSRNLSTITSTYEGIVVGFCLPYLAPTDVGKLIVEVKRLLVPDGILYLSFVEGNPTQSGYLYGSSGDATYFYFHELAMLTRELQKNGFKNSSVTHIDYSKRNGEKEVHTVLIATKGI